MTSPADGTAEGRNETERLTVPVQPVAQDRPRFPLLPVLAGVGVGALVAVLLAVLISMISNAGPGPAAPPVPSVPAATPAPAPTDPAGPAPTVAPGPRPDAGANECVDALGDGPLDLDSAGLTLDDNDLVVRITLASPIPDGDSGVGVILSARNGQRAYQLGVALAGGEVDRMFVTNLSNGDEDDLDSDRVRLDGTELVAAFPDDPVKKLGNGWRWYAFATVAGGELDACPGPDDPLEFQVQDSGGGNGNGN